MLWAVVSNAAVNVGVQMFPWIPALSSFAHIPVVELLNHMAILYLIILWNHYTILHSDTSFYISISNAQGFQFFHILPTLFTLPLFFWLTPHDKWILLYLASVLHYTVNFLYNHPLLSFIIIFGLSIIFMLQKKKRNWSLEMLHHFPKIIKLIYGEFKYITLLLILLIWRLYVFPDCPLHALHHSKRLAHTLRKESRKGDLLLSHIFWDSKENKWLK